MYGCVQDTEDLTYRILSHFMQILSNRSVYFIFSLMTAYENPEICILYIFIMRFLINVFFFLLKHPLTQFLFTHRAKIMFRISIDVTSLFKTAVPCNDHHAGQRSNSERYRAMCIAK